MKFAHPMVESLGIAVTGSRLYIAENIARRAAEDRPIFLQTCAFAAADLADGEVLRAIGMETPLRRVADGVVDHVAVGRVLYKIGEKNEGARPYIGILAVRAAVVAALNYTHLSMTEQVTKGRTKQRATNIAIAAFGVAAASGNRTMTHASGLLASAVAIATAPAHLTGLGVRSAGVYREL